MTKITLESETYDVLASISKVTGMAIDTLAGHIIKDGLGRIDAGGGFSISTKDGSIKYGTSLAALKPSQIVMPSGTGQASSGFVQKPQATMSTDPGAVREIHVGAL